MSTVVRVQTRQTSRAKSKSSQQSWQGKIYPSFLCSSSVNATRGVSSICASNTKKRQVDSNIDGDLNDSLTRKVIPAIVKAAMDSMPGASTHQLPDEIDTVERPGELDIILCCKIVSRLPICVHMQVRG